MKKIEFITALTETIEDLVTEGITSFNVYQVRGYLDQLCEEFLEHHGEYDDCSIFDREREAKRQAQANAQEAKEPKKYASNMQSLIDSGCVITDCGVGAYHGI